MASTTTMFLTGATTATNFVAQRQQAGAVLAQGEYSRRIANWNASIADEQAKDAIARGAKAEGQQRIATRGLIGAQRAGLAAQGVEIDSGSALDVQTDTARMGELDALTIRNNAAREALGYSTQAQSYRSQGELSMLSAENTASGLRVQSWGTLLTGVAQTYGQYRQNYGSNLPSSKKSSKSSGSGGTRVNWAGGDLV